MAHERVVGFVDGSEDIGTFLQADSTGLQVRSLDLWRAWYELSELGNSVRVVAAVPGARRRVREFATAFSRALETESTVIR